MTFLYFYMNWLFSESSLLTLKSSAKKFSTNTKIFSSAGFHVHHHLMLNIYKCWNKKNPVKVLNIMYTIVIQHCWIVKNSAQLQKFSAVLNFMYTLVWFPIETSCSRVCSQITGFISPAPSTPPPCTPPPGPVPHRLYFSCSSSLFQQMEVQ